MTCLPGWDAQHAAHDMAVRKTSALKCNEMSPLGAVVPRKTSARSTGLGELPALRAKKLGPDGGSGRPKLGDSCTDRARPIGRWAIGRGRIGRRAIGRTSLASLRTRVTNVAMLSLDDGQDLRKAAVGVSRSRWFAKAR